MKKLIVILAIAAVSKISAQPTVTFPYLGTPKSITFIQGWVRTDSGFLNAVKDTILAPVRVGEQRFRTADSSLYVAISTVASNKWQKQHGGGSSSILDSTALTNVTIGEKASSVVVDKNTYSAFPSVAWSPKRDTIFIAWKDGDSHAADGPLMMTYSLDGGSTFYPYDTIQINGSNVIGGTIDIGYFSGRLVMTYTQGTVNYDSIKFAKNDLSSTKNIFNFTRVVPYVVTASQGKGVCFGSFVKLPSGKLLVPAYTFNTPTDTSRSILLQSANNGDSWSFYSNILQSKTSGTWPDGAISETFVIRVEDTSANDNTATLIALIRSDSHTNYHYQLKSTDGGVTWTNQSPTAGLAAFGEQNTTGLPSSNNCVLGFPATMFIEGKYIYATVGRRGQNNDFAVRVWKNVIDSVLLAPKKWGNYVTVYRGITMYKGSETDFGYTRLFITQTHEMKVAVYDMSPADRPGVDGAIDDKRLRVVDVPARSQCFFESINNSGNQSITSGVETAITTGAIWYDSDSAYNSDSAKIYVPEDGWYSVDGRMQIDTSSLGTYRTATLYYIDPGSSYGTTASTTSKYIIDQRTVQPSTNQPFNFLRLHGTVYLYKGMEIRMTLQHDKGSALNVLNTASTGNIYGVLQTNADIRFKKIDK